MKTHHLLLALLCSALASCSSENVEPSNPPADASPTLRLSIACMTTGDAISRADTPFYEYGYANENHIEDAIIIITDQPINSGNGKIKKIIYLSNTDLGTEQTNIGTREDVTWYNAAGEAQSLNGSNRNRLIANRRSITASNDLATSLLSGLTKNTTYYATAFANFGNNIPNINESLTVAELRDRGYTGVLYTPNYSGSDTSVKGYGKFRMAPVNEVKFTTTPDASANIDLGTLMVQRLAARVDISFGNLGDGSHTFDEVVGGTNPYDFDDNHATGYYFPIYDTNTNKRIAGAVFTLTGIKLVNAVTSGTYLYTHTSGTPTYMGNEGWNESGVPSKFIFSPGSYRTRQDFTIATSSTSLQNAIAAGTCIVNTNDRKFGIYSILGYVGENTFYPYDDANPYTAIELSGSSNLVDDHINAELTGDTHTSIYGKIYLKHTHGAFDASNAMSYAVVRNTIYRVYVRFYSDGSTISVRYYYYNGTDAYDADNVKGEFTENYYTADFNKYILEGTSSPSND